MIRTLKERSGWLAVVIAACALSVAVSVVAYLAVERLRTSMRGMDRAHVVSSEGAALLSSLALAEGGVRGYALTGDLPFLDQYRRADGQARDAWKGLTAALGERARDVRLEQLAPAVADKHRRMARLAAQRSAGAGVDIASLQGGRAAMERIHRLVDELTAEETARYRRSRDAAERQVRTAEALAGLSTVVSFGLIFLVFGGMRREIASRRRAEETLRTLSSGLEERVAERTEALVSQRSLLRAALQSLHHGIIAFDAAGRVTFVNQQARRMDPAIEPGVGVADLAPTGILLDGVAVDMSESQLPVNRALRGETVRNSVVSLMGADGRRIELSINAQPITDEHGVERGAVLSMDDVTERRATEEQLRQATKMEAVGQLTGGVAHDFNNLLSVVIGNLDLLQGAVENDPVARDHVDTALSASLAGAEMTRRLLAFSRRQPLRSEPVAVNDLVRAMNPLLRKTLGERIEVQLDLAADLRRAQADPTQVEAALLNLAINARDAMPTGGRLVIGTQNQALEAAYAEQNPGTAPGDYVLLSVSDTGSGIAPEHLSRVFEPFFTTKEVGQGSGLGLSMIYGFAKQSGGHLKIYSELGHGTTVRLYLPVAAAAGETADLPAEPPATGAPDGRCVLVVEDNEGVRKTVVAQLQSLGYRTLEAATADEALARVQSGADVDLVFTDMVMPGTMSGAELGRAVRALRPDLPILYTSGFAEAALINGEGGEIHRENLLSKPYRKDDLARKTAEALGR